MLKHVQISPHRNRSDSVSLRSSISSSSSLCGSPEPIDSLRPSSRASSYCSLNETVPQTTIKVFTSCLRLDIEYKTLGIRWDTTSKDVVQQILRRCKMRQRDSRLFYLSMEVMVRKAGVKTVIALDDDARPAILQACHPKGDSRFCLQIKPGGLIRVHTTVLQPTSLYKSLFISEETTSDELLTLLLSCYSLDEPVEQFSLYEVCPSQEYQRKLHPDDLPLRAQQQRTQRGEQCHFIVRKNPHFIARRRQLLPPIVESKSTTSSTITPPIIAATPTTTTISPPLSAAVPIKTPVTALVAKVDDEIAHNRYRYTSNPPSLCHRNCVRELNYSRLTRVPTTDHLNDCQSHDDDDDDVNAIENISSNSFITTTAYSPVYNIREIRSVCNSFSSLGIESKKLWDVDCKILAPPSPSPSSSSLSTSSSLSLSLSSSLPSSSCITSMTAANRHSVAGMTPSSMNVVREAVNNNPAKGYGSYVYI